MSTILAVLDPFHHTTILEGEGCREKGSLLGVELGDLVC